MSKFAFISKSWVIDILGIGLLSSVLKQNGHEVDIFLPDENLIKNIKKYKPNYLCYSVTTGQHRFYIELNQKIRKEYNAISMFGGPHCTYFPDIYNEDKVDVVFQGEAEETIIDYLSIPHFSSLTHDIIKPEKNPQDLDSLPFPDRKLIYKFNKGLNPIKNIMTSRGCPFNCSFCYASVYRKMFKGKHIRYRSIDNVVEEAKQLVKNYPSTKFIFFEDDEFVTNTNRLREFSEKWIDLPYHAQLRIEQLTEEKAKLLKESGCYSATFAIESASECWRRDMLNRKMTNKQIIDGAKILRKYGIKIRTQCMIAQPLETIKDALATLDLMRKCKPILGWASIYAPFPSTVLGEYCRNIGIWDGDIDKIPSTFFEYTTLNFSDKLKKEFANLQRLFALACHYRIVRYLLRILIKFPTNKFYDWIYKSYKNYLYNVHLYNTKD